VETRYVRVAVSAGNTADVGSPKSFGAQHPRRFDAFSRAVFAEGALPEKTKQLIAVAVAHVTQCPYCITGHTKLARRKGASPEEIMETIWVAAEMRAGGAFAHAALAIHAMDQIDAHTHTAGADGAPS
jgi:AhpD family alkylhydroperoxidase